MEKTKKIIFLVYAALIVLIPIYIIGSSENTLSNGKAYKFRMEGRDPFDFWRGDFITINVQTDNIPTKNKDWKQGDKVYLKIDVDDEGYAYFSEALKEAPSKGDYLVSSVGSSFNSGLISIRFGSTEPRSGSVDVKMPNHMGKYFINEEYSKKGEDVLEDARHQGVVVVRVLNGNCRIEDVLVDGTPIMKYLE